MPYLRADEASPACPCRRPARPDRISLMWSILGVAALAVRRSLRRGCSERYYARAARRRAQLEQRAHARQVLRRVDAGAGRSSADVHGDALRHATARAAVPAPRCVSIGGRQSCGKRAQESGAVARRGRRGAAARGCGRRYAAPPSRRHGIGARLKYSARPLRVEHHLDDVRVEEVGQACRSGARRCSSRSRACAPSSGAQSAISAGSISGSSPCTLTTTCVAVQAEQRAGLGQPVAAAERGRLRVSRASTPCAPQASTMRASSAATTTRAAPRLRRRAAPRAPPSACRRCRPAACPAAGSKPAAPGSGP